ncbi:MAG: cupin domain-containing protein [Campylobacterota bacterium]|nr:cupin domain-containing protein [Campylobacterota bacterium]
MNIFEQIPDNLQEEIFEDIIKTENLKIERIISYGQSSPKSGWYESQLNEWVILLKGEALLSFEGSKDVRLNAGDYINITAFTKHRVSWTQPNAESVWLAIHY